MSDESLHHEWVEVLWGFRCRYCQEDARKARAGGCPKRLLLAIQDLRQELDEAHCDLSEAYRLIGAQELELVRLRKDPS